MPPWDRPVKILLFPSSFLIPSTFHHFIGYKRVTITNSHWLLVPLAEAGPPSSLFHLVISWSPPNISQKLILLRFLSSVPIWLISSAQNGTWRVASYSLTSAAILAQGMFLDVRIAKYGAARAVLRVCNCHSVSNQAALLSAFLISCHTSMSLFLSLLHRTNLSLFLQHLSP